MAVLPEQKGKNTDKMARFPRLSFLMPDWLNRQGNWGALADDQVKVRAVLECIRAAGPDTPKEIRQMHKELLVEAMGDLAIDASVNGESLAIAINARGVDGARYRVLLEDYERVRKTRGSGEEVLLVIPSENITHANGSCLPVMGFHAPLNVQPDRSFTDKMGTRSVFLGDYSPALDLRITTSADTPVMSYKNEPILDESQSSISREFGPVATPSEGRWFRFPLESMELTTLRA